MRSQKAFKTLKAECIYHQMFVSKESAAIVIFEYIETRYNRKRRHPALRYLLPAVFIEKFSQQKIAA
ncbi:IS3 family transposase [Chitinophaga oryziterrae]|uniref:IS3 family transposase n=1 Tax=Chitinophaga oryziterrae TaxID=1031224 RepID=A0A6N8J9R9_9BACT|nr:IS3 family transposase [Chitinophaga oryziterrae]